MKGGEHMETSNTQPAPSTNQSSFNPMIIVAIVAIVVIAGIAYMMSKKDSSESATTIQQEQVTQAPQAGSNTMDSMEQAPEEAMEQNPADEGTTMEESSEVVTINMDAGAFYYKPAEIRVKKGQKVKVVMTSKDMMHDFVIDELGVKSPIIKSGETNTVEFTPDKTGTFTYYCSVGQHRAQGQVGTIIVE